MSKENTLALMKKDVVDVVTERVRKFTEHGELDLPPNYSPENALKSAWLILQSTQDKDKRPALEVCTKDSVANALLDMIVQGLNPAKKQGYFIVYGNKLVFQRSYFGSMAVAKEAAGARDIYAQVVYKGDEFLYEINRGRKKVLKHVQNIDNVDPANIIAAYCVIEFGDERPDYTEIMTMDQIRKAWSKSKMSPDKDNSTHKEFPDQMAMKTVINRACKAYINSSDDSNLVLKRHFNRTDEELVEQEVADEINANANGEYIDVEYKVNTETGEITTEEEPEQKTEPETQQRPEQKAAASGGGPGF